MIRLASPSPVDSQCTHCGHRDGPELAGKACPMVRAATHGEIWRFRLAGYEPPEWVGCGGQMVGRGVTVRDCDKPAAPDLRLCPFARAPGRRRLARRT
jgi:hypothetical protein